MTADPLTLTHRTDAIGADAARPRQGLLALGRLAPAAAGALAVGVGAAAWAWAGPTAVAAAAAAVAAAAWWHARQAGTGEGDPSQTPGETQPLQQQVLPVWRRNVEAARGHAEQSMGGLVERFASLSNQLDAALGAQSQVLSLEVGATDELMARHQPEIDRLLAVTREVVAVKATLQATMAGLSEPMSHLLVLAQEVQSIGRATHLLALNASVEATRAGHGGTGFAVVAQEVRELAGQSRVAGQQIARHTQAMRDSLAAAGAAAQRVDTDDDELARRAEDAARGVVRALVGSLSQVSQGSRALRDAGRQVQSDIDEILVGLQSQDRLHQMLGSVCDDMSRMEAWMAGADDEAAQQPNKWLERLEASYTMEEMRTAHHGTVAIDRNAGVEFF